MTTPPTQFEEFVYEALSIHKELNDASVHRSAQARVTELNLRWVEIQSTLLEVATSADYYIHWIRRDQSIAQVFFRWKGKKVIEKGAAADGVLAALVERAQRSETKKINAETPFTSWFDYKYRICYWHILVPAMLRLGVIHEDYSNG